LSLKPHREERLVETTETNRPGLTFAQRLREAREARGLTQRELAQTVKKLGGSLNQSAITRIERGDRKVTIDEMVALAAALDVAPVHLFLPIEGDAPVQLTPKRTVDIEHARQWARGRRPLDPANVRFYSYQSPGDLSVSMEGASQDDLAAALAEHHQRLEDMGIKVRYESKDGK
jgi:transcriptional regulator with XRE-family HTH domain